MQIPVFFLAGKKSQTSPDTILLPQEIGYQMF